MAGGAQKTSQFNQATTVTQADQVPLLQGGELKRVTVGVLTGAPDFGWQATGESWTFSSYSSTTLTGVITVPSDATAKYSVGMRVRFSQTTGGTKYGTIIAVTTTSLSVIFAASATLTNETITSPVYSPLNAPASGTVNLADENQSFSTSAQATTQRWIDGKLIYKQTFSLSLTGSGSEQIFTIGLTSSATTVVKVEGIKKDTGSYVGDYYPIEYSNPAAPAAQNMQLKLSKTGSAWEVRCNSGSAGTLLLTTYYVL